MTDDLTADLQRYEGRPAPSVESLTGMLGWNSVAVFEAGTQIDGDTVHVNKGTVYVVMTDPWPEYRQFVFLGGGFHHADDLLSMEYEGVFKDNIQDYGGAEVVPLSEVEFISRDESGIPQYQGDDSEVQG